MNCTAQASSACYNDDVYWYDSCGVIGGIRFDCNSSQTCSNGVCVTSQPGTCGGQTCKSNEYCSNNVCLLTVPGNTYFVSTTGNDNNLGTFAQPWKTWQKAVTSTHAGDVTYIRGGIYMPSSHIDYSGAIGMHFNGNSGTAQNPLRFFNYPGETPILDGSLLAPLDGWNVGINIDRSQYIHFKGLVVQNLKQGGAAGTSLAIAFAGGDVANLLYENCVARNIAGRGYQHWSGAWNPIDGAGSYFSSDNTTWINCDAYNLYDGLSASPGNAADGWKAHNYANNYMNWIGCRAWNYSDDGFDPSGSGVRTFDSCWAMPTNSYSWEGNGFKTAGTWAELWPQPPTEPLVIVKNCIATSGVGNGFYNGLEGDVANRGTYINNFAYRMYAGFFDLYGYSPLPRVTSYYNNIAYKSTSTGYGMTPLYEVGIYSPNVYPHSNNNWRAKSGEDWPGWEYNPAVTVTDADFVSLDYSQLSLPRKADGSLPDITFGHLKAGSDLIDAGIVISGYHCSTSGAHPEEDCVEWYGSAPDIGAFEYQ
jgi:hypothetical protein